MFCHGWRLETQRFERVFPSPDPFDCSIEEPRVPEQNPLLFGIISYGDNIHGGDFMQRNLLCASLEPRRAIAFKV